MVGLTGGGNSNTRSPPSPAAFEAHIVVLEAVVSFLSASRHRSCSGAGRPAGCADSLRRLFPWSADCKGAAGAARSALRAVTKCTAWVAKTWTLTDVPVDADSARAGRMARLTGPSRCRKRSRAHAAARLLTSRLLAEVVEACGVPMAAACAAIRDEIKASYRRLLIAPTVATVTTGVRRVGASDPLPDARVPDTAPTRLPASKPRPGSDLNAGFCGDLIRALCGRACCAELARVLLAEVGAGGGGVEEDRLRCLLRRQTGARSGAGIGIGLIERFEVVDTG